MTDEVRASPQTSPPIRPGTVSKDFLLQAASYGADPDVLLSVTRHADTLGRVTK